jgi:preprotein translocase subunit SecB
MIKANDSTAFKFLKFRVSSFSFNEPGKNHSGFDIEFSPAGVYNEKTGQFDVMINFKANDKADTNRTLIDVSAVAEFKFDGPIKKDDIPSFFYANSIAVAFPYIRAFISTLTMQANSNVLMLGLINFTNMAEPLKEKTTVI